ncbi:hypothetical protein DF143_37460 [Burkholderia cenocepacia]|nr:hypothetical protein DF143_37460 [Burkholderia cenocepacia]
MTAIHGGKIAYRFINDGGLEETKLRPDGTLEMHGYGRGRVMVKELAYGIYKDSEESEIQIAAKTPIPTIKWLPSIERHDAVIEGRVMYLDLRYCGEFLDDEETEVSAIVSEYNDYWNITFDEVAVKKALEINELSGASRMNAVVAVGRNKIVVTAESGKQIKSIGLGRDLHETTLIGHAIGPDGQSYEVRLPR